MLVASAQLLDREQDDAVDHKEDRRGHGLAEMRPHEVFADESDKTDGDRGEHQQPGQPLISGADLAVRDARD